MSGGLAKFKGGFQQCKLTPGSHCLGRDTALSLAAAGIDIIPTYQTQPPEIYGVVAAIEEPDPPGRGAAAERACGE